MMRIPLQALPNQQFSCVLGDQNCVVTVRQIGTALYLSCVADDESICDGHICNDREPIPSWETNRFDGKFVFQDSIGKKHPSYEELGTRFQLYYMTAEEWRQLMS